MIKLFGQTSSMAVGTLLSRITGVLRDIAMVAAVGTSVFSDAYSVANSLPNIIYILIAGGAINSVFIPVLVRRMQDDADNGKEYADRLLTLVMTVLAGIVLFAMLFAPLIIQLYSTSEWTGEDRRIATLLAYWCLPQIFFYGVYTLASQVLNARNRFAMPMFAPIINNVVAIVTAWLFIAFNHFVPTAQTVTLTQLALLGAGTTLGVVIQAVVLIPALRKAGYRYHPRFDFRGAGLGKTRDLAVWTIGFVAINQLSFLIISNLTTYANVIARDSGATAVGFTSYQKGQLMMMLPHAIITVSLITALLPRLSRHAHESDISKFGQHLIQTLRLVATFIIPSAVFIVIAGPNIGVVLYSYGAATNTQGAAVGLIASMFAIGLPAFSLFYALLRSYYAKENTRTPFFINLSFNALHIAFGMVLFFLVPNEHKVAALALGYSAAYTLVCVFTWRKVGADVPELKAPQHARLLVRVSFAAIVAGLLAMLCHQLIFADYLSASGSGALIRLAFDGVLLLAIYIPLAWRLGVREIRDLQLVLRSRSNA